MHEFSLIKDLIRKIMAIAQEQHARKVTGVTVKLGALSQISTEHFREHFIHGSQGTIAEGARLNIEFMTDITDPQSQDVLIQNVEVVD